MLQSIVNHKMVDKARSYLCHRFGHRWRYKDYSNYIKPNGDKFDFTASRNCVRCDQYAYYYKDWKTQEKSEHDYENQYSYSDTIIIDSVVYK